MPPSAYLVNDCKSREAPSYRQLHDGSTSGSEAYPRPWSEVVVDLHITKGWRNRRPVVRGRESSRVGGWMEVCSRTNSFPGRLCDLVL